MTFVLTKEQIQAAQDFEMKPVPVPEWGGDDAVVYVKSMTSAQRIQFELGLTHDNETVRERKRERAKEQLIVLTVCDADGNLLFEDADIGWLREKSAKPIERLFDAARKLNGIGEDDVEQLVGNSAAARSDDSPSD